MKDSLDYFDESHRMLRQTVARFVEKEIKPFVEEWEEAGEFPRDLCQRAGSAESVAKEISMAKIFSSEICDKVCHAAVQIHGGYGGMRE